MFPPEKPKIFAKEYFCTYGSLPNAGNWWYMQLGVGVGVFKQVDEDIEAPIMCACITRRTDAESKVW